MYSMKVHVNFYIKIGKIWQPIFLLIGIIMFAELTAKKKEIKKKVAGPKPTVVCHLYFIVPVINEKF